MLFFWTLYSLKNPKNKIDGFHKTMKQHNVFNIDNNPKCFLKGA